jgi:hypothetical protein
VQLLLGGRIVSQRTSDRPRLNVTRQAINEFGESDGLAAGELIDQLRLLQQETNEQIHPRNSLVFPKLVVPSDCGIAKDKGIVEDAELPALTPASRSCAMPAAFPHEQRYSPCFPARDIPVKCE